MNAPSLLILPAHLTLLYIYICIQLPPLQKTETQNNGAICHPAREDYFECLHNRREHEIVRAVNAEEQKQKNAPAHGGGGDGGGH